MLFFHYVDDMVILPSDNLVAKSLRSSFYVDDKVLPPSDTLLAESPRSYFPIPLYWKDQSDPIDPCIYFAIRRTQNLGRFHAFSIGLPMISLRLHKQIASDPCVFTNAEAC